MRLFKAEVKETDGSFVAPTYMASDEFWEYNDPKEFLVNFWGLNNSDVESYKLFEVVDNKDIEI